MTLSDHIDTHVSPLEKAGIDHALMYSFVGDARTVELGLKAFLTATEPNELMLTGHFYDHAARLRSFEIASQIRERLAAEAA